MGQEETETKLFVSDQPLSRPEAFKFAPIISTLREFIASAPPETPLNICLSGGWGTGKTTLLRGLEGAFEETGEEADEEAGESGQPEFVTLWFDPWKLATEQEVCNALALLVLEQIERDASFASRAEIGIDRKNVLRMVADRLVKVNPDDVSTLYRTESRTRGTFLEIEGVFRRIADVYLKDPDHPRRLVIFVDDLDRCRPKRVAEVLEAVKLFFDLPGLIFVFALDNAQLERAVMADYGFDQTEARIYLEKIFQLTVPLPRKGIADLLEFLDSNLRNVGVEAISENISVAIVNRFGRNLRNLKLFVNSFSFQRRLLGDLGGLNEEALFKCLYLETTMSRAMSAALRRGSSNIVLALEFLAHGGFLHDDEMRQRYARELSTSTLNHAALIVLAIVAADEEAELEIPELTPPQRDIVEALRADGSVAPTLNVIREGGSLLIDSDLSGMIFLNNHGDDGEYLEQELPSPPSEEKEGGILVTGNPLQASEWDSAGSRLQDAGHLRNAYLCSLMAVLMDPSNTTYLGRLGRVLRLLQRFNAARLIFSKSYAIKPDSQYVLVETAYLHDVDYVDEELGSILYKKAIVSGSTTAGPRGNLSVNLHDEGRFKEAYLAALDACVQEPESERRLNRLATYAADAGLPDPSGRTPEQLQAERDAAIQEGAYPLPISEEEEQRVVECLSVVPDLEAAHEELSRPPV
jgi:hypothetical protein